MGAKMDDPLLRGARIVKIPSRESLPRFGGGQGWVLRG